MRHAKTGKGPTDHSLLQPDREYRGFQHLTSEEADQIDRENLKRILDDDMGESAA
jgi:hypothetical protein